MPKPGDDAGGTGSETLDPIEGTELTADHIADFVSLAEGSGESERATPAAPAEPAAPAASAALPVVDPAVVAPAAPPVPAAPAVAPAATPPVAPAVPAPAPTSPPAAAPATPPPSAPAAAPAAPAVPAAAPAPVQEINPFQVIEQNLTKEYDKFVAEAAKTLYPISSEDHDAFISGDTTKLSQLCARIHIGAMQSVLRTVAVQLPVFVNGLFEASKRSEAAEDRFWSANTHLDKSKHRDLLPKVFQTYNQLNPGVDEATRYKAVGILLAQLHGIPLTAQAPAAPSAPATPTMRTPGPVVRQVEPPGFSPGGVATTPAAPAAEPPQTPWSEFVDFVQANQRGQFDT